VLELAADAIKIEDHYSNNAGHPMPTDIESAKDRADGKLYIIQARPETVVSRREATTAFETYTLGDSGEVLAVGRAVCEKIASGPVRVIAGVRQLADFKPGEVLVAKSTTPDWEPVMKIAAAIVTERGGRTCHAAIVGARARHSRGGRRQRREKGAQVRRRGHGLVRRGRGRARLQGRTAGEDHAARAHRAQAPEDRDHAQPRQSRSRLKTAELPNQGVGLARMEFIISESVKVHPMALVSPEKVVSAPARTAIRELVREYAQPADYFIEKLSEGIGMTAATFYPKPVIVRLSDFKTNEYARLLGGEGFEPKEENPMLGFRGAARYAHPAYAEGFALECAALRCVRGDMGLTNVRVMVPLCRRVEEARRVLATMADIG
jgi:pyruvate, water dikinase